MRKLFVTGLIIASMAIAGCSGSDPEPESASPTPEPTATASASTRVPEATATAATTATAAPPATAEPSPTPVPLAIGPGDRLQIPSIGVDAALTLGVIGTDGIAPEPETEDDVILYDMSAFEGTGGQPGRENTIVYGKLDSPGPCDGGTVQGPCRGVFFDLRNVRVGDVVNIVHNETTYDYSIAALCHASRAAYPQSVFNGGEPERLTILSDAFTGTANNYVPYQSIVIAERETNTVTSCPEGASEGVWPPG